jgi:hypothetical protein
VRPAEALGTLAALAVSSAQEFLKALECARGIRPGGPREDLQDFLEAIHHIMAAERQADEAHRGFKRALIADRVISATCMPAPNAPATWRTLPTCCCTAMQLRDHVLSAVTSDSMDLSRHLYGIGLPGPRLEGPVETMGFKAFNLARMAAIGLPVPQAFVLGTPSARPSAMTRRPSGRPCASCWKARSNASRPPAGSSSAPAASPAGIGTLGRAGVHARNDGYHS